MQPFWAVRWSVLGEMAARRKSSSGLDPQRRAALEKLLATSKGLVKPQKALQTAAIDTNTARSDPPKSSVRSAVPPLAMAPVLETKAVMDDARNLNRGMLWEEIVREQGE